MQNSKASLYILATMVAIVLVFLLLPSETPTSQSKKLTQMTERPLNLNEEADQITKQIKLAMEVSKVSGEMGVYTSTVCEKPVSSANRPPVETHFF